MIYPYLKSTEVFQCPDRHAVAGHLYVTGTSSSQTTPTPYAGAPWPAIPATYLCVGGDSIPGAASYYGGPVIMPYFIPGAAGLDPSPTTDAQLISPSTTIAIGESPARSDPEFWTDTGDMRMIGHTGFTNFLFADGHVKSMKPTATLTSTLCMWNINNTVPTGAPNGTTLQQDLATEQANTADGF